MTRGDSLRRSLDLCRGSTSVEGEARVYERKSELLVKLGNDNRLWPLASESSDYAPIGNTVAIEEIDSVLDVNSRGATDLRYHTNLILNEGEDSQDAAPTSDPIIHQTPATAKSSQGRTKNFSSEEDMLLVSAWLNVGMDPIQGVDQSQGTYWRRMHEYFHANKTFESTRTEISLMNRWSGIQHDVNVFCECLSRIEARNQNGSRVDDKIANACALFKAEDKKQRKFTLMHCWNILKDKPKWMDKRKQIGTAKKTRNKKQKTVANSLPASVAPADAPAGDGDVSEPSGRPDRKKEKQKLQQRLTIEAVDYLMAKKKESDLEKELKKEEMCNKAFALQEERIKLEREKFEFERELEEDRIISLDLSTMTYEQQQYYEDLFCSAQIAKLDTTCRMGGGKRLEARQDPGAILIEHLLGGDGWVQRRVAAAAGDRSLIEKKKVGQPLRGPHLNFTFSRFT
ncbi:glutathione S-transferase T3-like [Panicum miliaceum]|uniref:Glutathione S-transferase T3-like n=1 Tax=Panicum miliaceum TaxID=4540 RepID=A0A3L6RZF1_PANMI|nr:glutathione S-transferase T3-like [Panicum miliaceum]